MFWVSQSLFYYKLFLTWPNPFKVQGPKQRCWQANRQQCFEPVWATHWWTDSKLPSVSQGEEETEISTEHSTLQKPQHCFAFLTLSPTCPQLPSHTIPGPQPTDKTGYRSPCVLIVRLAKKPKERYTIIHSKETTISRSRTCPSNPSLGFFPDSKVRKYLPFSKPPGKTPPL